jgi:hypothetical protein
MSRGINKQKPGTLRSSAASDTLHVPNIEPTQPAPWMIALLASAKAAD